MKYLNKILLALLFIAGTSGCSNFLSPSIEQNKVTGESINTVDDLRGLVLGALDEMNESFYYGRDYIIFGSVRSDDAFSNANSGRFENIYVMTPSSSYAEETWQTAYEVIANANLIINSDVPESPEVNHVKGQAYALRALAHMDLLLLYGQQFVDGGTMGIPYITTYGNEENFFPSRLSVEETWSKIGEDFAQAASLMSPEFDGPATTMTTTAVYALQSRYYLFVENYQAAIEAAEKVVGTMSLVSADSYASTWESGTIPGSIFEMAFSAADNEGPDALAYILRGDNYGDIEMTEEAFNLYGADDVRGDLVAEVDGKYRMMSKYPNMTGTDNISVIRYSEVILNYAEALARSGQPAAALVELNKIATVRNADPYTTASIDNILLERRKELAMEGRRFFVLMRTGQDVERITPLPNETITVPFGDPRLAFPIPVDEINANTSITQNAGYGG